MDKEERFKTLFKTAKERIMQLTDQNKQLQKSNADGGQNSGIGSDAAVERLEKEKAEVLAERMQEKERYETEIESLTQKVNQLHRQLGVQSSKPTTSSETSEKSTTEPPTANIKPMAGT